MFVTIVILWEFVPIGQSLTSSFIVQPCLSVILDFHACRISILSAFLNSKHLPTFDNSFQISLMKCWIYQDPIKKVQIMECYTILNLRVWGVLDCMGSRRVWFHDTPRFEKSIEGWREGEGKERKRGRERRKGRGSERKEEGGERERPRVLCR